MGGNGRGANAGPRPSPIGVSFAATLSSRCRHASLIIAPAAILAETDWLERLASTRIEPAALAPEGIPKQIVMLAAASALDCGGRVGARDGGAQDLAAVEGRLAERLARRRPFPPTSIRCSVETLHRRSRGGAAVFCCRWSRYHGRLHGPPCRAADLVADLSIRRLAGTAITPNQMSLISIAVGICGGPFFLVLSPIDADDRRAPVSGALDHLDGCDGELARLKFQLNRDGVASSIFGATMSCTQSFSGALGHRLESVRRLHLAAMARRCGRSRDIGLGRLRLLAADAPEGRLRYAVHLGVVMRPSAFSRACSTSSPRAAISSIW